MKKLFTTLITLTLLIAFSLTSMAQVTIEYTFKDALNDTIYTFGRFDGSAGDLGVEIKGTKYNLDGKALEKANFSHKFGIGISDPKNVLGDLYDVKPYKDLESGKTITVSKAMGDSVINENTKTPDYDATLKTLTVAGKEIPLQEGVKDYYMPASNKIIDGTDCCLGSSSPEIVAATSADGAKVVTSYEYFYNEDNTNYRCGNIAIDVTSKNNLHKERYNVYIRDVALLPVSKDTDLRDYYATNHQGHYELIYMTTGGIETLLMFDIGDLKGKLEKNNGELDKAILRLHVSSNNSSTVTAYKATSVNWDEDTLLNTDFYAPKKGDAIATVNKAGSDKRVEIDVSSYLKELVAGGQKYMNIIIGGADGTTNFSSKESGTPSVRPYIMLSYKEKQIDLTLKQITLNGNPLKGFDPDVTDYYIAEPANYDNTISYEVNDPSVTNVADSTGYFYYRDNGQLYKSRNYKIEVSDKLNAEKNKRYTVHLYHPQLIPAYEDTTVASSLNTSYPSLPHFFVDPSDNSLLGIMKFDISHIEIPEGKKVYLRLSHNTNEKLSGCKIYKIASDWKDTTVKISNMPVIGAYIADIPEATAKEQIELIDITDYVKEEANKKSEDLSILFKEAKERTTFYSCDAKDTGEYTPALVIK